MLSCTSLSNTLLLTDLWSNSQIGSKYGLLLLTFINLFNYIDRYLQSYIKDIIKKELNLTDTQTSAPLTMFIIIYMLFSPIFGYLADNNWNRLKLISFGIFIWSIATTLTALSNSFGVYLFTRMMVGIGEAAYGTISPAIIADYFPIEKRSKALSIFYIAVPVGSAIGFAVGGTVGAAYGWRAAFAVCGLPGIILAIAVLYITEPEKGISDDASSRKKSTSSDNENTNMIFSADNVATYTTPDSNLESIDLDQPGVRDLPVIVIRIFSWMETLNILRNDADYVHVVVGLVFTTFAVGGMADWLPAYMVREVGWNENEASLIIGAMTVVGGLVGTLVGSWLNTLIVNSELLPNPEFFLMFTSLSISTIFAFISMYAPNLTPGSATFFLFVTQFFMWMYTGPANTIITSVSIHIRVRAFAVLILLQHAFGDAISPVIVGAISDSTGSLKSAVSILPLTLGLGALSWMHGYFYIVDNKWLNRNTNSSPLSAIGNASIHLINKIFNFQE